MALTTTAYGRAWHYCNHVGRSGPTGMGFSSPIGLCVAAQPDGVDVLYVANRGSEYNRDSRITLLTLREERFVLEFARYVELQDGSQFRLPRISGIALDRRGYIYITDEWYDLVFTYRSDGQCL